MTATGKAGVRCRHRGVWIVVVDGHKVTWCYRCGAIRINYKSWVRPVGPDGDNPVSSLEEDR